MCLPEREREGANLTYRTGPRKLEVAANQAYSVERTCAAL